MDFRKNFYWMCLLSLCLVANAHNLNRKEVVESLIVESSNKEALRSPQKYIIEPIQTLTKVSDNFAAPPYDAVDFGVEAKLNEVEGKNDDSNLDVFKVGILNTQDKAKDKSTQTEGNLENTVKPFTLDNIQNENKLTQNEQQKIGNNSPDSRNSEINLIKAFSETSTANEDEDKLGLKDDLLGKKDTPLNLIKFKTKLDSENIENPSNYLRTFPELISEEKAIISKTECNNTKNVAKESINFATTIPRKENLNLIKVESSNVDNLEKNKKEISGFKETITSTVNITKDQGTKPTKGDNAVHTENINLKENANETLNSETITPSQDVSETGINDSKKVKESITSEPLFVNSASFALKKLPESVNDKKTEDQINLVKSLNKENEDEKQQISKKQSENLKETLNSISTTDATKINKTTSRETSNDDKTKPTKGDKVETTKPTEGSLDSEKITPRQLDNDNGEKGSQKVEETLLKASGFLANESGNNKEIKDQPTLVEALNKFIEDNKQQISENSEKQSGNLQGILNIIAATEATKIKTTSREREIDNKTKQTKDDKTVTTADSNLKDKADGSLDSEKITNTQVDNVFDKVKETNNTDSFLLTSPFLTSDKVPESVNDTVIKDQTNLVESLNIQQISENQSEHLQETLGSISTTEANKIEATSGETSINTTNAENQHSPPKTNETTLIGVNEVQSNEPTLPTIILENQTITQPNTETYPSTTTEKIPKITTTKRPTIAQQNTETYPSTTTEEIPKRTTTKRPPKPLVVQPVTVLTSTTTIKPVTENPTKATTKKPTATRRPIFGWWPFRPTFIINRFNTTSSANNQTQNTFSVGILAVPLNWRPRLPNLLPNNRFSETSPRLADTPANTPESRDLAFWNTLFHRGKTLNETGSLKQNYVKFNKTETTNDTSVSWKPWKNVTGSDFFKFLNFKTQNEQAIIPANTQVLLFNLPVKYPFHKQIVQTPTRKLNDKVANETVAKPVAESVAVVEDKIPVNVSVTEKESDLAEESPKELPSSSAEGGSNDEKAVMAKGNEKAFPIFESELLRPVVHFARRVMSTFMLPENLF